VATKSKRALSITLLFSAVLVVSPIVVATLSGSSSGGSLTAPVHPASGPSLYTRLAVRSPLPGGSSSLTGRAISCPEPAAQCSAFYNWAGYAVCMPVAACAGPSYAAVPGAVSYVAGSWTVPKVTSSFGSSCSDRENTWFDSVVWIGIDGYISPTVEQTGTGSDCFFGQTQYFAWYEFFPSMPSEVIVPVTVDPGDSISASVSCGGTPPSAVTCSTTLTDKTNGQSFTSPSTPVPGADLQSAEWIEENSFYDETYLSLTPTTPVLFTSTSATIGGASHPLSGWGSNVYWFPSVTYDFGSAPEQETLSAVKAIPSPVYFGGSFTIRWLSSGP
jgi:hypothetical protein